MTDSSKNSEKVMATSPGNEPGREAAPTMEPQDNTKVSPNSDINTYNDFGSSKTKGMTNPYDSRMGKLVETLGNKDSVKG